MANHVQFERHPPTPTCARLPWILAGAVVTALAVLAAVVIYTVSGDEDITARWETPSMMTSNPWTPSIVKPGAPINSPGNFVGAVSVASVAAADDCDKEALKKHLGSDPRLAKNWADALGIGVSEINGYIDRLQSRRLTVPVQVTNHDYEGDSPRELQSVLDTGTAVLTDADGIPRVRCACGNPLKPSVTKATEFDNLPPSADPETVVTDPKYSSNTGTAIRLVARPFIKTESGINPKTGYTIDSSSPDTVPVYCSLGDVILYGKDAARCGFDAPFPGACWIDGDIALCARDITETALSRHRVIKAQPIPSGAIVQGYPLNIELSNGSTCTWTSPVSDGTQRGSKYGCTGANADQRTTLRGELSKDGPKWLVKFDQTSPQSVAEVLVAYFAVDEP